MTNTIQKEKTKGIQFNTFTLKLIAIITMAIDHIAFALGMNYANGEHASNGVFSDEIYVLLRCIGRIAFPIFCYLIAEGYLYTHNLKNYIIRLFVFAIVSQVPFSLAFFKTPFYFSYLNVYFTLAFGLLSIYILEHARASQGGKRLLLTLALASLMLVSFLLNTDYNILGIVLILEFYFLKGNTSKLFGALFFSILIMNPGTEMLGLLALIPISLHNHKKGPGLKYVFYFFYPVHLILLYLIDCYLI